MGATLRRLPALAGLAAMAAIGAEAAGHRAFARLVRRDVEALHARAFPGRAGVVTEEMLADLPEPVRRYLRYTGVVGKPFPGTIRLRQKGRMRLGPGQMWLPLDAEEHYSVQPPGFVWAGTARAGPLAVARARDMYAEGTGQMLVKVASLWPVVDASGEQMNQAEMLRYLNEMIWFPAAFLAANISFEPAGDSSARSPSPTTAGPSPGPCSSTSRGGSPTSWPSATGPPAPATRIRGPPRSPATANSKGCGSPQPARRSTSFPAGTSNTST